MIYQWDSSLETGNAKIDSQHKQLISVLDNIIEASHEQRDTDEVFKTLNLLTGYTIMHFATEEKFQLESDYPDYPTHKNHHDDFRETVGELMQQLIDEGPTAKLVESVTTTIGDWLLNHIKKDDYAMAQYFKSKANAAN